MSIFTTNKAEYTRVASTNKRIAMKLHEIHVIDSKLKRPRIQKAIK